MGKFSFLVGAGVGYVLGARAGRQQFERLKSASSTVWQNPRVQGTVHKAEAKVTDLAREKGSQLTDAVAGKVKQRISGTTPGSASTPDSVGMTGSTPPPGAPEPTPPQPDIEQR